VIGSFGDSHPINKVIKVSAISSGSFEPGESKPIPLSYVPPKEHRINQGDVLFGRASGSLHLLGATAVVDHDPDQLYLPDKVWKLTIAAESPLTTNYVLGLLRSRSVREFVRHNASGAAGVRNISKSRLLSYEAAVPSSEDQSSFSLRHEQIEKVRLHHQLAIREGARLFASLQSRAFEGEL
jgi:type I restriction enzyme S subunit